MVIGDGVMAENVHTFHQWYRLKTTKRFKSLHHESKQNEESSSPWQYEHSLSFISLFNIHFRIGKENLFLHRVQFRRNKESFTLACHNMIQQQRGQTNKPPNPPTY